MSRMSLWCWMNNGDRDLVSEFVLSLIECVIVALNLHEWIACLENVLTYCIVTEGRTDGAINTAAAKSKSPNEYHEL
jgi:hypothetical protein